MWMCCSCLHLKAHGLFPHLILDPVEPPLASCFHLPTNHPYTSPVDKAIHSAAHGVPDVHRGNRQRQARKEKGHREIDEDFYLR